MTTETSTTTPKVWIGCLAAYNDGHLHGEWIDAAVEDDELWEAQKRVLKTSPVPRAEEHFIADYEGFGSWRIHEYESLGTVATVARLIEKHGPAFTAWVANDESVLHPAGQDGYTTADEDELEEGFSESYRGEWESEEEYAREQVSEIGLPTVGYVFQQKAGRYGQAEMGEWPETLDLLDSYLDWDTITRSVMEDYWTEEANGKVYVFSSV